MLKCSIAKLTNIPQLLCMEIYVEPEERSLDELKNNSDNKFSIDFKRIGQIITQPRLVFSAIEQDGKKAEWKTPIIVVSVIILIASLLSVTSSASSSSASSTSAASTTSSGFGPGGMGGGGMPGSDGRMDMQATTTTNNDDTTDETASQDSGSSSTILTKALSALGSILSFMLTWLILGSIVNLLSISFGGQANTHLALVFAAWASIPIGVRAIMQILYALATTSSINAVGLSGFAPTTSTNAAIFLEKLLAQIDIYTIWQVILLAIGISVMTKLNNKKPIIVAISSMLIIILIKSLLGLGIDKLSSLEISSSVLNNLIR